MIIFHYIFWISMTNWYDIFVFCNNYHFWFCQFLNLQYSYMNRIFKTKYGYLKIQHYILWTTMTNWCNLFCKLPVLNFVEFVKISMDFLDFTYYSFLFFYLFLEHSSVWLSVAIWIIYVHFLKIIDHYVLVIWRSMKIITVYEYS